ncbi:MAG TPA: two-component regulator propeller domain-containing protein [Ferruginibacter sp.]|nr:two-component regulator propeller domain-containing protein [Ferruginibacter sp.]
MRTYLLNIGFLFCLKIAIGFSVPLYGQPLLFENYSSEQGLSQNSCYSIAQDNEGFMWFGTQDGLNRYDGKQFKVFLPQNDIGKELPSNYISALFFDQQKNMLWVGTLLGTCMYNPLKDSLSALSEFFPFAARLENTPVKKIISFKANEYWFITYNHGLMLLNTSARTLSSFFDDEANKHRVNSIVEHNGKLIAGLLEDLFYLIPDGRNYKTKPLLPGHPFTEIRELYSYRGSLWIGTLTSGCFYLDEPPGKEAAVHPFKIKAGGIGCFMTDAAGKLWIGTRGDGIIVYDPVSGMAQTAAHDRYDSRTPGKNFVLSLFKDRQGIMWCGLSGSGLAKFDPLKFQFHAIVNEPSNPASLPDNMIFDMYKTRDGHYYVGTQNQGIAEWDVAGNRFHTYSASSKIGVVSNTIYDITEDDNNNLWIASWGGLMQLDRKRKLITYKENNELPASKKLYGIIKLKQADSLFITGENGSAFFSLKDQRWAALPSGIRWPSSYLGRYMYEDDNHIIWVCTVGAGLGKYDYRRSTFEVIEPVKKYAIYVRHLLPDGQLFWLATDNGIILYNHQKNMVVKHLRLNTTGLSNVCYAIQKDNAGFFWVSTNMGIYKINPQKDYAVQHYNTGNGLSFLEYNTSCTLKENDGNFLFGGTGGITSFNPADLEENEFSPVPVITAMQVNDVNRQLKNAAAGLDHISLTHDQNFITFNFAVTNFSNQNNNQFAYRLKGLSENWTNCGNRNFVSYTSLPPGDYVFEIRSSNSDGKWCEGMTTLAFSIHPPWWQTWWFRISALAFLAGLITWFVRRRIQVIRREATLKQKITETEMMALRAQMNPHFIFNSLNSIREMILHNENKEASHFLSKFAQLIRMTLNHSGQSFISLRNTMEYLHRYVEMEQVRNADFTCRILADDELDPDETILPPMLIQPFIENAIWHGTSGNKKNININVDFKKVNDQLVCIIDDNGIGINQSLELKSTNAGGHQPVGISNIQNRIHLLNEKYNLHSSITVEDKLNLPGYGETGTIVTLRLPLEITKK